MKRLTCALLLAAASCPATEYQAIKVSPEWRFFAADQLHSEILSRITDVTDELKLADGETVKGIPVQFENDLVDLNKASGTNHQALTRGLLVGTLEADANGTALLGIGADWWWDCYINGKPAYGRAANSPCCNAKTPFGKTNWVFPVQVKKGRNLIAVYLVSGESWLVGIGPVENGPDVTIVDEKAKSVYLRFAKDYPEPKLTSAPDIRVKGTTLSVKVRLAQPFPAGLQYRVKGETKWQSFWNTNPDRLTRKQSFKVEGLEPGKEYEANIRQIGYFTSSFTHVTLGKPISFSTPPAK